MTSKKFWIVIFKRECKITGDLFGLSVFAACTVIHKVSRAIAKQKGLFLSLLKNLADTKRKFSDVAHFSSLHFSLFMTLSTFHDYVSHGPFPRLEFQPPSASLKLTEVALDTIRFRDLNKLQFPLMVLPFFPTFSCHI